MSEAKPVAIPVKPVKATDEVALYEVRRKVYPRAVSGIFARWRWAMVWFTQLLFYGLAWVQWNDRQALLFHLTERKFYLFGWVFWPQDVFYLTVLLIICAYSLFLFTAVAGRLWCGYACPQTVYTEIFLWIERKIEGDRAKRMKLDNAAPSFAKFATKAAKYGAWGALALWTGITFVGYFSPIRELLPNIARFELGGWELFWICFYGGFTYLMAGVMREQVCKYMCPYARFQGVMFDPDTLVITYDPERGEPRGAKRKQSEQKLGDCVDCGICVQVCPTGIDIRDGLQYECIGCAACIDACDQVMDKVGSPRGLIRYTTENAMKQHWGMRDVLRHVIRPRVLVYLSVLLAIIVAGGWSLAHRDTLRVDVIRDRTTLSREVEGGLIENIYTLQMMNMAETTRHIHVGVSGLDGVTLVEAPDFELPPAGNKGFTIHVRVPADSAPKGSHKIVFDIRSDGAEAARLSEKASFMMP
ncbi:MULTISPECIES: cytochrome c oxidase accessory protein CcoG [Niveibacterium]|uniref:Cytochrome c oxidase accessory protein CcoG n=1 Tax=Niveibacterium microcysteis TaxID=2811415 RepID=A0ABX7M183_9RHOO|nr:cytochrome c oxidase accessory protein CcoG [Niveibacterium microcysteis]QSI75533.1 cytochrome c oxidase accessory protein CcoG [Niveibacterium microcysteis]